MAQAADTAAEWSERAREALAAEGHRIGGAREAVVEMLGRQSCCRSAQEIADELRSGGGRVGLASVYRTLDLLHGLGLVQRVDVGEGGQRYEPVVPGGEHHHHAVCERCGRLTRFEDRNLEQALERLSKRIGHPGAAHEVVIRGTCARCKAA